MSESDIIKKRQYDHIKLVTDEEDGTFMEFQKFGLYDTEEDEHSADHNRKITYNDGIFYMFDVYG